MAGSLLSKKRARRFENRGNVAILFALLGTASVTVMGGTIELSRLSSSKATLNAAADLAALAREAASVIR